MSITLELTEEEEVTLRQKAAARQMDIVAYIREKVFVLAPNPDGNVDPDGQVYSVARALAVLEELGKPEHQVSDAEWEAFQRGIDDARPGQRSIYGQGMNPPTA